MYSTNGTILTDEEMGEVIQLQGDQRKNVVDFFVKYKVCDKEVLKVHGF
jgi:translation initiation factor 1